MSGTSEEYLAALNYKIYPVFDLLETYLSGGAYLAMQEGDWCLFHPNGEVHVKGETIRAMLVNLILSEGADA